MHEVALHQVVDFRPVKRRWTDIKEALKTFTLAESTHIKEELLSAKVDLNLVRNTLQGHSGVESISFRQSDIFKCYANESSIFCEEDLFFVDDEAASNNIMLLVHRPKLIALLHTFFVVDNPAIRLISVAALSLPKMLVFGLLFSTEPNNDRLFIRILSYDCYLEIKQILLQVKINRNFCH